jgi:hypothetical protein
MSDTQGSIQYRESMTWVTVGGQFPSRAQQRTISIDAVPLDAVDRMQAEAERLGVPKGTVPQRKPRLHSARLDLMWEWIDYSAAEMIVETS